MNDHPNSEVSPVPSGPAPIDPHRGRAILKRMAGVVVVSAGGFLVFASLVTPARCSGATRSAKLKWQERQEEVKRSIEAAEGVQGSTPAPAWGGPGSNQADP